MSTAPAACAGAVAVICVALFTVNVVAAVAPKLTAVAPVRLVPVMVTLVPPAVVPEVGETLVTVGAAGRVVVVVAHTVGGRHKGFEVVVGPPVPTTVAEMPSVCGTSCGMTHCVAASPGPTSVAVTVTDATYVVTVALAAGAVMFTVTSG